MFDKKNIIAVLLLLFSIFVSAQNDTIKYDVGILGIASTGSNSPFWLQSKSYGKISSAPTSAYQLEGIYKDYGKKTRLFDYGFKANLLIQTDVTKSNVYFHEFYAKARFSVFDLIIGSREEILGNQDSTLSCGGFLFSQNSRPIPKITIGIEHFIALPFTNGFVEIKGALTHGWFTDNIYDQNALLHHKYVYLKLGGKLPVHIQYGLDHVAQWGGNIPGWGKQPASLHDFVDIFFGRSGGSDANRSDQINALGNHIISQSMKLDIDISDYKISGYWQNLSEDGPIRVIWNTMNIPDGLWGISIRNNKFPFVKGILYEYLNTTDQSGPFHDKDGVIYGGIDDYFNNYLYLSGWTNFGRTIGTPFITSPLYNTDGNLKIENNRVQVHHFGFEGEVASYQYKLLSSFSKNYGVYVSNYKPMKPNTSLLLEVNKKFPKFWNLEGKLSLGADFGTLFGNSVGCMFTIKKSGVIFSY
ncbi:MAG: capsule assembly Wzi family protein [Paludibacter sp.]|nr:capsule assembly Wzi family protein [Paludibacter sp.]